MWKPHLVTPWVWIQSQPHAGPRAWPSMYPSHVPACRPELSWGLPLDLGHHQEHSCRHRPIWMRGLMGWRPRAATPGHVHSGFQPLNGPLQRQPSHPILHKRKLGPREG